MSVFISYIFLGLSLSAPIGPINAAQLDKGIKNGFFHAWLVGMGAMVADAIFMLLIYFGVASFLSTPFMKTLLFLFGFFVLVYTGIESIIGSSELASSRGHRDESKAKSFRAGFFMALSNPLNILFWLGIYGAVLANTSGTYESFQMLIYSLGIFLGIFIWDVVMAGVASGFKHYMNVKVLQLISIIAGISLIGFGIYFAIQAYKILFG
ncbi:LysE family translocator [Bacillus timonensis]|nr:LysE family translocator [Bacillus timonensis]